MRLHLPDFVVCCSKAKECINVREVFENALDIELCKYSVPFFSCLVFVVSMMHACELTLFPSTPFAGKCPPKPDPPSLPAIQSRVESDVAMLFASSDADLSSDVTFRIATSSSTSNEDGWTEYPSHSMILALSSPFLSSLLKKKKTKKKNKEKKGEEGETNLPSISVMKNKRKKGKIDIVVDPSRMKEDQAIMVVQQWPIIMQLLHSGEFSFDCGRGEEEMRNLRNLFEMLGMDDAVRCCDGWFDRKAEDRAITLQFISSNRWASQLFQFIQ